MIDPQATLVASTTIDVNANQTNPTFSTGGVTEFHLTDPTIAIKGSNGADYPYIQLHLNTSGRDQVTISYDLRDLDGSASDAIQPIALQYRIGESGNFTNLPAGFVGDATQPNAASLVTHVSVTLPDAVEGVASLQVRIMTGNAQGTDEYVGVDNILVTSVAAAGQSVNFTSASTTTSENIAGGVLQLPVNRTPSGPEAVTVDYTTTAVTASAGSDFTTTTGTLTFGPGVAQQFINVPIVNDASVEPIEQFKVTLSNPTISPTGTPISLGTSEEFVTVNDDDRPTGGKLLSAGPLTQNWNDVNQIVSDDDWSGVAYITGYRGDDLTPTSDTGYDPQTILADGNATPVDVNANKDTNYAGTNQSGSGGVAEFDTGFADPSIALNGSGTADAPFLLLEVNTTGVNSVDVSYNLRDLDSSTDNATQQVALQYRVGNTGNFTNVAAAYVLDATDPGSATKVTPIATTINDAAIQNQPLVQFRIMTTNAGGNDEYVGVDDIVIEQTPVAGLPAWVAPGSAATWDDSIKRLTVTGAATIIADPGADNPNIEADGPGAVVTINPTSDRIIHISALTLSNNASAVVTSVGAGTAGANQRVLVVSGGIGVIGNGGLDITDNAVVVKGMDLSSVTTLVHDGYNAGNWNGGGIHSSKATIDGDPSQSSSVGAINGTNFGSGNFQGVPLTGGEVLVKYTYTGDANLDAKVDIGDLGLLSGSWQQPSGKSWFDGDFTFDGAVNIGDLGLLSGNWQKGVGG